MDCWHRRLGAQALLMLLEVMSLPHGEAVRAFARSKVSQSTPRAPSLTINTSIDHHQPPMDALLLALGVVIAYFLLFGDIIAIYHYCARTAACNAAKQRFHANELELEQLRGEPARRAY